MDTTSKLLDMIDMTDRLCYRIVYTEGEAQMESALELEDIARRIVWFLEEVKRGVETR